LRKTKFERVVFRAAAMSNAPQTSVSGARHATGLPPLATAMLRPDFYPQPVNVVELRQTHTSYVFLAGDLVYKVKKPVRFPFIDCSDLHKRRVFCFDEVRLNSRFSPRVYLGVHAIFKRGDRFSLGPSVARGHPKAVEYAVKMVRLPDDRMLDHLVVEHRVVAGAIRSLATRIAQFHAGAATSRAQTYGSSDALWRSISGELAEDAEFIGRTLERSQFIAIETFCRSFIASHRQLLDARVSQGRVREGHGDLRAEHISISDGRIEVIDCVEFSERLRYGDVASEIAFLAMDLERLEAAELADELVEAYAEVTNDEELPMLMPFYKCYRACVRGKVESLRSLEPEVGSGERQRSRGLARRYFALAYRYACVGSPALIVVCGLSGTGKSTLARALQHRTGFRILSSDRVRKRLAGIALHERLRSAYKTGVYSEAFSRVVYGTMLAEAENLLKDGCGVILDATFKASADRLKAREIAAKLKMPVLFVECVASRAEAIRRIERRAELALGEVSDATAEVYELQRAEFERICEIPARNHLVVDTTRARDVVLREVERALVRLRPRAL
jgi:aminoglycoside phosphotransferase family enzyme/predicted kinase